MSIAIGTYVDINVGGDSSYFLQNFHQGSTRTFNGRTYQFAGFGYTGTTVDLEGANVDAQLVFVNNPLSMAIAKTHTDLRSIIQVHTVVLTASLNESSNYTTDTFMLTGFSNDLSRIAFRLSSPLDAVTADVPRRRLSSKIVGALPSTGSVNLL